jgi:hypothetical protein
MELTELETEETMPTLEADGNTTSLTLTNVELDIPAGVNDTFTYQIYLWSTSSYGTVSPLTGSYGNTYFQSVQLDYATAYSYQLPYNSYYATTTYGCATVYLEASESVTIPDLPEGCSYMILASASANYYVKNATCTYGTVDDRIGALYVYNASGPNEVVCYNDYAPNSLRISESVMSSDPDSVYDTFTFTIYLYSHSSTGDTPLFEGDSVNVEISIDGTGPAGAPTDLGSTLTFETKSPDTKDGKLPGLSVTGTYNVATVTLKHGQSIVLKNLGKGYGCYVYQQPETHYMLYELASRHVYEKNVVADDFVGSYSGYYNYINSCNVSASLGFTNAQETLSITKQVENSDTTRDFVFNVYFLQYLPDTGNYMPMREGTFNLSYTNPTGNEPKTVEIKLRSDLSKETTFADGVTRDPYTVQWSSAQIRVAAGQTVTIEELPAAIAYFIEEVPTTNYTLTNASSSTGGTVNDNYNVYNLLSLTDESATFTNTYTPPANGKELTISKTVTGNMGDTNQAFTFSVTLTDADGSPLSNMDFRVLLPGETDTTLYTTDANGVLTFSLKHGDQVTIKDLPQGTRYTITEGTEDDAKSYKTTFVVTGGTSNAQEDKTQSGALNDGNAEVKVTNDRNLVVPTGIQTETQPAALILLLSAGALLLLGVAGGRKRRRG